MGRALRRLSVVMDETDAEELSAALILRWPDLRFLPRRSTIRPTKDFHRPLPYVDSLAWHGNIFFDVWREPLGWEPLWLPIEKPGFIAVMNEPTATFAFQRSKPLVYDPKNMSVGEVWAFVDDGDDAQKRFVGAVWREIKKRCSNSIVVDHGDGSYSTFRTGSQLWIANHAAQWCLEYPDRRIGGNVRPYAIDG